MYVINRDREYQQLAVKCERQISAKASVTKLDAWQKFTSVMFFLDEFLCNVAARKRQITASICTYIGSSAKA